ncbi:hypothetical protein EB796_021457 [Bugula neritina]|uniref:Uncharacterized protein n=1 Tax=Bugula neritina TaxID=10212 RepID=A0A7J7J3J8_BUGNE|nr:hypothetical protein EB796_021457 [Bugula neritina]
MTVIRGPKLSKDKGYSWVIVFTSFLSHFANIGFSFGTAGNLTMAHQDYFNVDLQIGSFIGTAHISVLLLFGPIASVLVKKLGCRLTEFFGGSLLLLGVGLSMLSKDLWHAIVFYSVLAGVGVSCTYTASSQILALHFDRLKYLAFSLAMLGNYVGMMVWPLLSQLLFKKFGYSQAMGIMTSSHLLHLVAGMSFFEPKESFQESISDVSDVSAPNLKTDFIDLLKSWKVLPTSLAVSQ